MDFKNNIWSYLQELSSELSLSNDKGEKTLEKKFRYIDASCKEVPLANYIGIKKSIREYKLPSTVIYPFGCNASQKEAVEKALTNQISVIQGPPGTGKTQTILNIIANLLLAGKTILIVSNSNAATENVAEKLSKKGTDLGFLVAELGSKENEDKFKENPPQPPIMNGWEDVLVYDFVNRIQTSLTKLEEGFDKQSRLSRLRLELSSLLVEKEHFQNNHSRGVPEVYGWLNSKASFDLLRLKLTCEGLSEIGKDRNLWFYVKWLFKFGFKSYPYLHEPLISIIEMSDSAFYYAREKEIREEIKECEKFLESNNIGKLGKDLSSNSLSLLKYHIARQWGKKSINNMKPFLYTKDFYDKYPIVLSSTYSATKSLYNNVLFDYVIMDESSQVDIVKGALSLACARNCVIVGDEKQLPPILGNNVDVLRSIESKYKVPSKYSSDKGFLSSVCEVIPDAPQTLLREHYRCHHKIINFCNEKYYNGNLVIMTDEDGMDDKDVVNVIEVDGGHMLRENIEGKVSSYNMTEIDIIEKIVSKQGWKKEDFGIISPYIHQCHYIKEKLGYEAYSIDKFQGHECKYIIISFVSDRQSKFIDDPQRLNVAISRAVEKIFVIVNKFAIEGNKNIKDLYEYALYNNCKVEHYKFNYVFDLLYLPYTKERELFFLRQDYDKNSPLSENLMLSIVRSVLKEECLCGIEIVTHYPLSLLVRDESVLSDEERMFIRRDSHIDILLYATISKKPLLCIEVDGATYHEKDVQSHRDIMKDDILKKYGIPIVRFSTKDNLSIDNVRYVILGSMKGQ